MIKMTPFGVFFSACSCFILSMFILFKQFCFNRLFWLGAHFYLPSGMFSSISHSTILNIIFGKRSSFLNLLLSLLVFNIQISQELRRLVPFSAHGYYLPDASGHAEIVCVVSLVSLTGIFMRAATSFPQHYPMKSPCRLHCRNLIKLYTPTS